MKIELITIGKKNETFIEKGIGQYISRIRHYNKFDITYINSVKFSNNLSSNEIIRKETDLLLKRINSNDYIVLLDERGKSYSSMEFAAKLKNLTMNRFKKIVFIIGGSYGVSDLILDRANETLALSNMTFSHQMARLFFLEQIYRAYTIINQHPYHNE